MQRLSAQGVLPRRSSGVVSVLQCLVAAAACLLALPVAAAAPTVWELLTPFPAGDFERVNLEQFAAEVEQSTDGALKLEVLPATPPLQGEGLMQALSAGRVPAGELMLAEAGGSEAVFQVDMVPFLVRDYDQARALWEASRPVLQPRLEASGLQVMFVVPRPPGGLFVNRELWTMEDFRGLRLLSDGSVPAVLAPLLGMQPVALPAGTMIDGFRASRIDAAVAAASRGAAERAWTSVGNFYDLRLALPKSVVAFNRTAFASLDPEVQRVLLNAAVRAQNRGWQGSVAAHNGGLDQLRQGGMTVAVLPPETASRLTQIGEAPARDLATRAGAEGERILAVYRSSLSPQ